MIYHIKKNLDSKAEISLIGSHIDKKTIIKSLLFSEKKNKIGDKKSIFK